MLKVVIFNFIDEKPASVCEVDLFDSVVESLLEMDAILVSVLDPFVEFFRRWWVNKQKVSFDAGFFQIDCTGNIYFDDRDQTLLANLGNVSPTCSVKMPHGSLNFSILNKFIIFLLLLKLIEGQFFMPRLLWSLGVQWMVIDINLCNLKLIRILFQ